MSTPTERPNAKADEKRDDAKKKKKKVPMEAAAPAARKEPKHTDVTPNLLKTATVDVAPVPTIDLAISAMRCIAGAPCSVFSRVPSVTIRMGKDSGRVLGYVFLDLLEEQRDRLGAGGTAIFSESQLLSSGWFPDRRKLEWSTDYRILDDSRPTIVSCDKVVVWTKEEKKPEEPADEDDEEQKTDEAAQGTPEGGEQKLEIPVEPDDGKSEALEKERAAYLTNIHLKLIADLLKEIQTATEKDRHYMLIKDIFVTLGVTCDTEQVDANIIREKKLKARQLKRAAKKAKKAASAKPPAPATATEAGEDAAKEKALEGDSTLADVGPTDIGIHYSLECNYIITADKY